MEEVARKEEGVRKKEGLDEVDGALFSRISSKQSDIDKLAKQRAQNAADKENKGRDDSDRAQLSEIPSQKNNMRKKDSSQDRVSENIDENDTLECTIKPEDLNDSEGEETKDISVCSLGARNTRKESSDSATDSNCSARDDVSDAIQGSRVSLNHFNLENEEQAINQDSSSTFYAEPRTNETCLSESKTNDEHSPFYLPDSETEDFQSSVRVNPVEAVTSQFGNCDRNERVGEAFELTHLMNGEHVPAHEDAADKTTNVTALNTQKIEKNRSFYLHLFKALIFPIISLIIYIWDIGSDIRLAVSYKESGDLNLFWITLACIVVPHVLMAVVDVSWVWLDRKNASTSRRRFILGCLTFGRIVRALTYMHHIYKAKLLPKEDGNETEENDIEPKQGNTRNWHKARARDEKRDCFMLDFINAFAESAPQLFVQLYLYYKYDLELNLLRVLNLLSSWISIAWTYAAYYRCNREALKGHQDVNIVGFSFFFCSVLAALAARYVCTTLFLVYFELWIGAVCALCHFILMALWIFIKERPMLEGAVVSPLGRYLYYVFFAYVCILCFMNLKDTRARKRMTVFYTLIYIENTIMAALALWKMNETGSEKTVHVVVLPVGFLIHVVLFLNYYLCLHPKTGVCFNCSLPRIYRPNTETQTML